VSQEYGALLRARARGQETVPFSPNLVDMLGRAEVTLALRVLPELKSLAPRLRWVQLVSAGNETAARNMVPSMVRGKARVVKVDRFTPEQIRAMHKAA
jgi:hypothetical protein